MREAITNCEASTLLVCLDSKRIDGRNNESRQVLEQAGVYEELFGDQLQRKIGQVVTMTSIDLVRAVAHQAAALVATPPHGVCAAAT